jgi:hypothetical protein
LMGLSSIWGIGSVIALLVNCRGNELLTTENEKSCPRQVSIPFKPHLDRRFPKEPLSNVMEFEEHSMGRHYRSRHYYRNHDMGPRCASIFDRQHVFQKEMPSRIGFLISTATRHPLSSTLHPNRPLPVICRASIRRYE